MVFTETSEDQVEEVWIIDHVRTPRGIGKVGKGALADLHPQHLFATTLKALKALKSRHALRRCEN